MCIRDRYRGDQSNWPRLRRRDYKHLEEYLFCLHHIMLVVVTSIREVLVFKREQWHELCKRIVGKGGEE